MAEGCKETDFYPGSQIENWCQTGLCISQGPCRNWWHTRDRVNFEDYLMKCSHKVHAGVGNPCEFKWQRQARAGGQGLRANLEEATQAWVALW